jgi:hypothetical protein
VDQQLAAMPLDIATELIHCVLRFQRRRRIGVAPYLRYRFYARHDWHGDI